MKGVGEGRVVVGRALIWPDEDPWLFLVWNSSTYLSFWRGRSVFWPKTMLQAWFSFLTPYNFTKNAFSDVNEGGIGFYS